MIIKGVFCKLTNEIIYSRSIHDCIFSEDKSISVDGGFEYFKVTGDIQEYIIVHLDSDALLEQILFYDYKYSNKNANEYPNGYYGRFKIGPYSNTKFYKKLVTNFNEIKDYFIFD